jgi:hypothetical protein
MYCRMHAGCMSAKTKNLAMQNIARFLYFNGAGDMNRTRDLLITNSGAKYRRLMLTTVFTRDRPILASRIDAE